MRVTAKAARLALLSGLALACLAIAAHATSAGPDVVAKPGGARSVGVIVLGGVRWGKTSVAPRIYLVRADGKGLRQLTAVPRVEDVTPAWSPNARQIVFGRRDARGWRIYTMDATGGHVHAITSTFSLADAPTWSPDGRKLAFEWMPLHPPRTYAQQVVVVNANGTGLRVLTSYARFKGGTGHPAWSPDGRTILFSGRTSSLEDARTDLWAVRPDGRGVRRLLANANDPAWSPDGHTIAFSRRGDIYTATAAGTGLRRLTHGYYADSIEPSWSADGTQIVFSTAHYDKNKQETDQCVTVMNADGTNRRDITRRDPDFWATSPSWQPAA